MSCNDVMHTICLKQYDTVSIVCEYLDDLGQPVNLTGTTIKSNLIASSGGAIRSFTVVNTNLSKGVFELKLPDASLAVGTYKADILFTDAQKRLSSDAFALNVIGAITTP